LSRTAISFAAVRSPSGAIAAASAGPLLAAPASASTTAPVNDTIIFLMGVSPVELQGTGTTTNTLVDWEFRSAMRF
jgi:hypothetical protein